MESSSTPTPSRTAPFWLQCLWRSVALLAVLTFFPYAAAWAFLSNVPAAVGTGFSVAGRWVIENPLLCLWFFGLPLVFSFCCMIKLDPASDPYPRWLIPCLVASAVAVSFCLVFTIFGKQDDDKQATWATKAVTVFEQHLALRSKLSKDLQLACGTGEGVPMTAAPGENTGRLLYNCERDASTVQTRALSALSLNALASCLSRDERFAFEWQTVCVEDAPSWDYAYNSEQDTLVQTYSGLSRGACRRFYNRLTEGRVDRKGGPFQSILINGKSGGSRQCTEAWDNTVRLEQSAEWVGWIETGEKQA